MFLSLLGSILASWETTYVSATMFPEVGKQRNIDRKHNVGATTFPSLPMQSFRLATQATLTYFYRPSVWMAVLKYGIIAKFCFVRLSWTEH